MITIKESSGNSIILGTDGEKAVEAALKYYIYSTGDKKALDVLKHLDPYWVLVWKKETKV